MAKIKEIVEDNRVIQSIIVPHLQGEFTITDDWAFSQQKVDEIKAYWENGQEAIVPWIAVIKDNEIITRIPAHWCQINYKKQ